MSLLEGTNPSFVHTRCKNLLASELIYIANSHVWHNNVTPITWTNLENLHPPTGETKLHNNTGEKAKNKKLSMEQKKQ